MEGILKGIIENTLQEAQSSFDKGRRAQDHIFTIKEIIRKTQLKRERAYFAFIGIEEAFDTVHREKV